MDYITRAAWGARAPRPRSSMGRAAGVALHWEGPRMGDFGHDQCAGKVRGIQNFHMNSRDWADIAYNFVVCPHGAVLEGRGLSVRSAANGTNDGNARYLAICYLGGDGDPFTDAARQGFLDAIEHCRVAGNGNEVRPHSSFKATACPGNEIRAWIASGLPGVGGAVSPPPTAPPTTAPGRIAEDGVPGRQTWRRMQDSLNKTGANPQLVLDGDPGKATWRAVQARVNHILVTNGQPGIAIDGIPGPQTYKGMQFVVGVARDGKLGRISWTAIQRRLNNGEF